MIIGNLYIGRHLDGVRVCCKVTADGLPSDFCYFIRSTEIDAFEGPDTLDWAVIGLIYVAMQTGQDIHVSGPISESLHFYANDALQEFLRVYEPSLKKINVTATELKAPSPRKTGRVGTGFSAGVDSLYAVKSHGDNVPKSFQISDLFVFGVGGMGTRNLFEGFWDRLKRFTADTNYRATSAWSNLPWFYFDIFKGTPDAGYEKTVTLRNASAALVFSNVIDRYLVASSYPPDLIRAAASYNPSYMDPIILPMIGGNTLDIISANCSVSRLQKTIALSTWPLAQKFLDICIMQTSTKFTGKYPNCSGCRKCARTMLSLDILGHLDKFGEVFDLEFYQANRQNAIEVIKARAKIGRSVDIEVVELAKERNISWF